MQEPIDNDMSEVLSDDDLRDYYLEQYKKTDKFPAHIRDLDKVKPVYETLPGWNEDTTGITEHDQLPENAQGYVKRIEELTGVRVGIISVGPKRTQTIVRKDGGK